MNNIWYLEQKENIVHEDKIINQVLLNRGLDTENKVDKFIKAEYSKLADPYLLTDLTKAVQRLIRAINNEERIIIYGDYDVDGITSTSLFIRFFEDINFSNYDYYIPNRLKEGYGLRMDSLDNIDFAKYDLLITVDCGITAVEEVDYLNKQGVDVLITDHHKLGDEIPAAVAVIDPQREESDYFKVLAGVGVVFKFLQAVEREMNLNIIKNHLDLAALGTVADIVELKNDNRIMVKEGLEILKNTKKLGLEKLLSRLKLKGKKINPGQIGYIVAPPINAIGRMEEPEKGVKLLTTNNKQEAEQISEKLIAINRDRQKKEEEIYKEALAMINKEDIKQQKPIVLHSRDWHRGVIGIVASRLVEKYYLPVILIAIGEDGIGHGSARSISKLDITEGLKYTRDLLENYGGHSMAAGLSIKEDRIDAFKDKLNQYIQEKLSPEDFIPGIKLDSIIKSNKINEKFHQKLDLLKPYGVGNPRPKFLLSNIRLKNHYTVGKENKHLKIQLENGISGICFNMGELDQDIKNKNIDLVAKIYLNNWRGKDEVEIRVEDINVREDHTYFPITFQKNNYTIYDKRGIKRKLKYLEGLKNYRDKIAVFINGSKEIKKLKEELTRAGFEVVINDWRKFNNERADLILFDKVINCKMDKDNHLVLYSIPFSLIDFYKIVKNFDEKIIHLIFNNEDLQLNERLINQNLPTKKTVKKSQEIISSNFSKDKFPKKEIKLAIKKELNINLNKTAKVLDILEESKFLKRIDEEINVIGLDNTELDLSNSVYYNNIINIKKRYQNLRRLLRDKNLFKLINKLTKLEEENDEF
ncbi:MAG TPA: single-stranded-DNA-specific exonuclease RecJ [Halanaerobiales bacterium]|nr:single-stranded-DNA-specific exonuclease RecJ [Halanaerobiales bacterium]